MVAVEVVVSCRDAGNFNSEKPFACGLLLRTDLMDLSGYGDDFSTGAYSQNVAEAWSIKDGHLHSTLTPFIRLGQQEDRRHIGISNIVTHHA
ncbi:hypothetical protein QQF64_007151 [Cirrhinus molitorella]|uniref:MHC class I antigen n=1 Tax=Cirrhinus molitorella TaxID=172907 RepID=A0ABR3MC62_9TELE